MADSARCIFFLLLLVFWCGAQRGGRLICIAIRFVSLLSLTIKREKWNKPVECVDDFQYADGVWHLSLLSWQPGQRRPTSTTRFRPESTSGRSPFQHGHSAAVLSLERLSRNEALIGCCSEPMDRWPDAWSQRFRPHFSDVSKIFSCLLRIVEDSAGRIWMRCVVGFI